MGIVEMGIASRGFDAGMAKQLADHRQAFPAHRGMAGEGMAQIVEPKIPQPCGIANLLPCRLDIDKGLSQPLVPEYPGHLGHAGMIGEKIDRFFPKPDRPRPGLAFTQPQAMPVEIVPLQRQDFAAPTAGEQKQCDRRRLRSENLAVAAAHVGERSAESGHFGLGQVPCPDRLAVLPDTIAGIGILDPVAPSLRLVERCPQDGHAAVGGTGAGVVRQRGEPFGNLGFGQAIDVNVRKGAVDVAAPVIGGGLERGGFPGRRAFRPIFPHEIVHARRAADALACCRGIVADPGMGDHAARYHGRLMPGEHGGRADGDRPHPPAHPGLNNIDVPPAGTRFQREEKPDTAPALKRYNARMLEILQTPLPLAEGKRNELQPRCLAMSAHAINVWRNYADHLEGQLGPNGEMDAIRGLANKLPEHAARLAGVLALVENIDASSITADHMRSGAALADHYAAEALRLFGANKVNADLKLAQRLLDHLHTNWTEPAVSLPDIYQRTLNAIGDKATAARIVRILEDHGWLREITGGATINGERRREAWSIVRDA